MEQPTEQSTEQPTEQPTEPNDSINAKHNDNMSIVTNGYVIAINDNKFEIKPAYINDYVIITNQEAIAMINSQREQKNKVCKEHVEPRRLVMSLMECDYCGDKVEGYCDILVPSVDCMQNGTRSCNLHSKNATADINEYCKKKYVMPH